MTPPSVLLVDDSLIVRRVLRELVQSSGVLDVCGSAANGALAVQRSRDLQPDLVVLDLHGSVGTLETLRALREADPELVVVCFVEQGRETAVSEQEACEAGAFAWVAKPPPRQVDELKRAVVSCLLPSLKGAAATLGDRPGRRSNTADSVQLRTSTLRRARQRLRGRRNEGLAGTPTVVGVAPRGASERSGRWAGQPPKVPVGSQTVRQSLSERTVSARAPVSRGRPARPQGDQTTVDAVQRRTSSRSQQKVDALLIGVSTGGPNALAVLLKMFPSSFPVPVVIVQHMPVMFTRLLAERLDKVCPLDVAEAEDGEVLKPGTVRIAKGGVHLKLRDPRRPKLVFDDGPAENSCKPAVDVMFRSAAEVFQGRCLAVVMTGMGADGAQGAGVLTRAGGQVIVQDEATSVVWGMPGAVVNAGHAEMVLPLKELMGEIVARTVRR